MLKIQFPTAVLQALWYCKIPPLPFVPSFVPINFKQILASRKNLVFLLDVDSPVQIYVFVYVCTLNLSWGFVCLTTL